MNRNLEIVILLIITLLLLAPDVLAQHNDKDSIITPFRKGRWLIGLSGKISSSSTEKTSLDQKIISNSYAIEINISKFVRDRLNMGFTTTMERDNFESTEGVKRTTEIVFIGPKSSYYLVKSEIGSLFFGLSPGLVLYRNEFIDILDNEQNRKINKGTGFGILATFGYSYVIYDRVAFDIGLNWNHYWIDIQQESLPERVIEKITFNYSDFSFSFGFNILLD